METENITPDEAKEKIASVMNDPKHSYFDRSSPDHKRSVEEMSLYYKAANPESKNTNGEPSQPLPELQEGLEAQEQRQSDLYAEAEEEMDALEELGFERGEIPDDLQECQLRGLREQRLCAEGNYEELGRMLEQDLTLLARSKSLPLGKINAIQDLIRFEGIDPGLREEVDAIADGIIRMIVKLKRRK